tara:strand:+ start:848 stop:1066 length:219 start_codon:yes stop_codon:yes gene_type:complete
MSFFTDNQDILMDLDSLDDTIREWKKLIIDTLKSDKELSSSAQLKIQKEIRSREAMFMFKNHDNLKKILRDV